MIYRITTAIENGTTYLTSYRLISERGEPTKDDEIGTVPWELGADGQRTLAALRDENGKLRLAVEPNPDHGKRGAEESVDTRRWLIVERKQELTPAELAARETERNRATITAALPDLLLAAADGKDIGAEVRKLLGEGKQP